MGGINTHLSVSLLIDDALPPAKEFAALMILVAVLQDLPARIANDRRREDSRKVWQQMDVFKIDHGRILTCLALLYEILAPMDSYQKRRVLNALVDVWKSTQDLYKWGVKTFGPTATLWGESKDQLDVPDVFKELFKTDSSLRKQLGSFDDEKAVERL